MLPDFPQVKAKIKKRILIPVFERARKSDPLLSSIRHTIQHEGHKAEYQTVSGEKVQTNYEKFSSEYQITREEVESGDFESIFKKFQKMGDDAASALAQYSFKFISQVIDKTGNTVNANGKFTYEKFIEVVDKMPIDFDDETGEPRMPSLYIHPDMAGQVKELIQEAESNPENKSRFEQIMERKKEEWRARENSRKLVD